MVFHGCFMMLSRINWFPLSVVLIHPLPFPHVQTGFVSNVLICLVSQQPQCAPIMEDDALFLLITNEYHTSLELTANIRLSFNLTGNNCLILSEV